MHFQITRNGQTYGPYTLEDLQRYVSSGNILPSDLAKSESMNEWIPVSQVLAGQTGTAGLSQNYVNPNATAGFPTPGFNNPGTAQPGFGNPTPGFGAAGSGYSNPGYGQPAEYGAAPVQTPLDARAFPDAPNLNWGLLLLIDLLTCGLFQMVWNLVVAAWLKRVQPNSTSLWYYIAYTVLRLVDYGVLIPAYYAFMHTFMAAQAAGAPPDPTAFAHSGLLGNPLLSLLGLGTWVIKLVARFIQRANLQEHFNTVENVGLQLNPVMVFFFGGLYFQYHLNKINGYKQQLRMATPTTTAY